MKIKPLWWLNPAITFSVTTLVPATIAWLLPERIYQDFWGTQKHFGAQYLMYVTAAVGMFWVGTIALSSNGGRGAEKLGRSQVSRALPFLRVMFGVGFLLTSGGYLTWVLLAWSRGLSITVLAGVLADPRTAFDLHWRYFEPTLPGVTTLTQVAIGTVIIGAVLAAHGQWHLIRIRMSLVLLYSLAAAFLLSSRLVLIELVLPICLVYLRWRIADHSTTRHLRVLTALFPLSLVLLYLVFAMFEYFRSWLNVQFIAYEIREYGFLAYAALLLLGYYATSLNNGALLIQTVGTLPAPYFILEWFWRFPVVNQFVSYNQLFGRDMDLEYRSMLEQSANASLNNPSGVFLPFVDLGIVGGLVFWLVAGITASFLYRGFRLGHVSGLLLYPYFFIGLLEAPRILYWTLGREFPSWFFLIATVLLCRAALGVDRAASPRPGPAT